MSFWHGTLTGEISTAAGWRSATAICRNPISRHRAERRRLGFNGAAGIHRRKPARGVGHSYCVQASMGPPEFTGGNITPTGEALRLLVELQWGRRNSPAETRRIRWS